MESRRFLDEYEQLLTPARERFATSQGVTFLTSPMSDAALMESFLLHFCAIGSRMTEPVEGWLRRSSERCKSIGMLELARALQHHAQAEAGHHLMMIADVYSLAIRWNAFRQPPIDANEFLSLLPGPGALRYCQLHEDTITSESPYDQVAIQYEIEMLPVRFGEQLIARCIELLGGDILSCLSFITEHIVLDVGHTRFNARELEKLIEQDPTRLPTLVAAGTAALDAYAQFVTDCTRLAALQAQTVQASLAPRSSVSWQVHMPLSTHANGELAVIPDWVEDVRSLRGSILYDDGRRPQFKRADGRCYDPDPADLHAYHVLAYQDRQLIGCVRLYPLGSEVPYSTAEALLGAKGFAQMFVELGVEPATTIEIGRWVVHPKYRKGGLAVQLAAGAAALARYLGFQMTISSVGTEHKQDRMLALIGLRMVPTVGLLTSEVYNDRVRLMYGTAQHPKENFVRVMDQMAQILQLNEIPLYHLELSQT